MKIRIYRDTDKTFHDMEVYRIIYYVGYIGVWKNPIDLVKKYDINHYSIVEITEGELSGT